MIEVYRYDRQNEQAGLSFRINNDATVDGSDKNANRVRQILSNYAGDPVADLNYIEDIIEARYNNQYYATNRQS